MKVKNGFNLRTICGEYIIVAEGKENIDFSNIISMNESSAYLWEKIHDKDFTNDDLAHLLTEQYEVDFDTALADAKTLTTQWLNAGLISEE
ncbi:MAG: PqqD family protein [Prevotella sp.]|nr:PqqD family protein [Prevotella sp.]